MCSATEFDELPVRHNEDLINAELAKNLPLPISAIAGDLPMWDPHIKAFLLIQAFMSRIDLPISDYVGDQTSVLDQGIRVIQACIDVLAELGYPDACWMMMTLLQCIKSARWPGDYPLSILPGVSPDLEDDKATTGKKLNQKIPSSLAELVALPAPSVNALYPILQLDATMSSEFSKALSILPNVTISVADASPAGLTVHLSRHPAASSPSSGRGTRHQSNSRSDNYRIYAPKFPKPQTEGWFILVTSITDPTKPELLALKRAAWTSGGNRGGRSYASGAVANARARIKFGDEQSGDSGTGGQSGKQIDGEGKGSKKTVKMRVKVISDAYVGMEWSMDVEVAQG
jgi:antiviral helicase SLH1